jgi:hypothetical protein
LAFAIDRGYEGFQERAEENAILFGLKAELTTSLEDLQRHLAWHDRWDASIADIRAYLNEGTDRNGPAAPEIVGALRMLYSSPTFDPSTATLDVIESSGRGRAIVDRELRTLIAEWRVHAEDAMDQQQTLQRSRETVLWPLLLELQLEAPRPPPGEQILYREPPTAVELVDSDLNTVLSYYGMIAQISGDDWRQVFDATEAILERLTAMGA